LTGEILDLYTPWVKTLTLTPSSGGRFEVRANGQLIFSKKALGRHATPGEVVRLLEEKLGIRPTPVER
jgi:selenoprotein W-related protein